MELITTQYEALRKQSSLYRERRDCAVVSLAVVLNCPYSYAHALLERKGRKRRKGTPGWMSTDCIQDEGYELIDVTKEFSAKTVRTLERQMRSRPGVYLVNTIGHILTIKDGVVCDWTKNRLHRVLRIKKVVPKRKRLAATSETK